MSVTINVLAAVVLASALIFVIQKKLRKKRVHRIVLAPPANSPIKVDKNSPLLLLNQQEIPTPMEVDEYVPRPSTPMEVDQPLDQEKPSAPGRKPDKPEDG